MVAKSFQQYPVVEGPYAKNNKEYVIIATKTNPRKEVRWYSETEYLKLYPPKLEDLKFDAKKAFGFDKGLITVFAGGDDDPVVEEIFRRSAARYSTFFGWYIIAGDPIPQLPVYVHKIPISWNDISMHNKMLPKEKVKSIIDTFKKEYA